MTDTVDARVVEDLNMSANQVYHAWLSPDTVRIWLSKALQTIGLSGELKRIELDPTVGGKFFFSDLRDGQEARHWGTYQELQPDAKIVFTWITDEKSEEDPSMVTMTLAPSNTGCQVTLTHRMDAQWKEYIPQTEHGWRTMLQTINNQWGDAE